MFHTKNILNRMMGLGLLASVGFAALLLLAQTNAALAATAPPLGSTSTYGIVSSTYGNTDPSTVNGNICCTTCSAQPAVYTGIPLVACTTQIADQATALANLLSQPCTSLGVGAIALNGVTIGANPTGTFPPGCYSSGGAMSIATGTTVTLSGPGVYIFRSGGALNGGANSIVTLADGACASDVFWAPNGATTIGANATFVGSIIEPAGAGSDITIGDTTTILGRALAAGNTVTIAKDAITVPPACVPLGQVFVGKVFDPSTINEGCVDVSTLTITLSNPNATAAAITSLTDTLPAGTQVAGTPNASNGCGGTFTPGAGDTILTMTGGTIPGGLPGICTMQVDVCAPTLIPPANRSYVNPLPAGALVTSNGNNANSVFATLVVLSPNAGPQPPTISKSFNPVLTNAFDPSTLTFILSNPSTTVGLTGLAFTDTLPPGLVIAGTPAITNTCNGSVSAAPFGNTVTLTGGSIAGTPGSCTITVNVIALERGIFPNTLIAGDLTANGGLSNALPAVATLTAIRDHPGNWVWQYPETALIIPYFNCSTGFQSFVMISHVDTSPDWGTDGDVNVFWRFNPKCGRGNETSAILSSHASFVKKCTDAGANFEGWVEIYEKTDIADGFADADFALEGIEVILDLTNGVVYNIETVGYKDHLCVDGSGRPVFYNCTCSGSDCSTPGWGDNSSYPILARLFRESDFGRSMFVLLDPSGRHIDTTGIPNPAPSAGWDPSACALAHGCGPTDVPGCKFVSNWADLHILGKDETNAELAPQWCCDGDVGKPGIVTIGVGSTTGPSGIVADQMINNPSGLTDAPYGFGQAYNLRDNFWVDANLDGVMNGGPAWPSTVEVRSGFSNILGAVLTQISPMWFPYATHAQQMASKWTSN